MGLSQPNPTMVWYLTAKVRVGTDSGQKSSIRLGWAWAGHLGNLAYA